MAKRIRVTYPPETKGKHDFDGMSITFTGTYWKRKTPKSFSGLGV